MIRHWTGARLSQYIKRIQRRNWPRTYSSNASTHETICVPCQSNGSIGLNVYQPLNKLTELTGSPTVLVYLPRGPPWHDEEHDASNLSILQQNLPYPVVEIKYRLSREQQYPTPVHDILAGYDWILNNLLPKRAITRAGRSEHVGKLAVCGESIGGGLAAALALTECRIGEPAIVAAALNNPLVDWVSIGSVQSKTVRSAKKSRSTAPIQTESNVDDLLASRRRYFRKPQAYFDPFASPTLFFRSAGVEVPPEPLPDPQDDMEHLSFLERDVLLEDDTDEQLPSGDALRASNGSRTIIRRKASRRFPGKALGLKLPRFHISSGLVSPLNDQTGEFTTLLRQSVARQSKYALSESSQFGRKVLLDDEEDDFDEERSLARKLQAVEAERKVILQHHSGLGLWDDSPEGKARVLDVAKWLHSALR